MTRPTWAYKRKAWLAVAGLGAFIALYLFLIGWFAWTAYRLFAAMAAGNGDLAGFVVAAGATFFAAFMIKGLFFFKRSQEAQTDLEVKASDEPRLFEFLHRLADEAGAPRPHRVFLSARVNAAVFYDLSPLNLLWPSRKNLEIGLALVNVLSLGEVKAVLAHEFGHFAQRSMAVGRWVYVAQQIAGQIISRRDGFDRFLQQLSRIDLRVAWVGWIMQLITWSIRSLMETVFRGVVLAQRALSREMELQADLVAVSLTGSDALVNALHRLPAAEEAWNRTLRFAAGEFEKGRPVADLFVIQRRIIGRLRDILDQPDYGAAPPVPAEGAAAHRLFKAGLAKPPQMWATHPVNAEREENAKRIYIPAAGDERPGWALFADPARLRRDMSLHLLRDAKEAPAAAPVEDSLAHLDREFNSLHLDRRYRGVYLGRSAVRQARTAAELYGPPPAPAALRAELSSLYPEALVQSMEHLRALNEELQSLQALRDGFAQAAQGNMVHRGVPLKRRKLPQLIAQIEAEILAERRIIEGHDARCRGAHLAAANSVGPEWSAYLTGLAAVLHYADHAEANLRDVQGCLANVIAIVTARGRVNEDGLNRLLTAAGTAQDAIADIYGQRQQVKLDAALAARLEIADWASALGELKLPPPTRANIGEWLRVVEGWINRTCGGLSRLRLATLDLLLATEARVAEAVATGHPPDTAPAPPSQVPTRYPVLTPGSERPRQKRLHWWDRFQLAHGLAPTAARLAVALVIVGGVLTFSGGLGKTTIAVFNGLERPVRVTIGKSSVQLGPGGHTELELAPSAHYAVAASTLDGQAIEAFDADAHLGFGHYVYNIAGAAPLVEWTAVYGDVRPVPERRLGAPRWSSTHADFVFADPPRQISTKSGGGSRTVLSGLAAQAAGQQIELLGDSKAAQALIDRHARWDSSDAPHFVEWLSFAANTDSGLADILSARLRETPNDVLLRRMAQDSNTGAARAQICAMDQGQAAAAPDNGDLQYLAARCIDDPAARDRAFAGAYQRWPDNPWLQQAVGYDAAELGRWPDAIRLLDQARRHLPALKGFIALDLYRIHRLVGSDSPQLAAELSRDSEMLRTRLDLEQGKDLHGDIAEAYHELAQGHLGAALSQAGTRGPESARMLRLVAASDGADAGQIERALALPADQGIDNESAWSALGLALRGQRDPEPFIKALELPDPGRGEVLQAIRFVQTARPDTSQSSADAMLAGLKVELRGEAYSAAVVALGDAAPPAWRHAAGALLFAGERPSFRQDNGSNHFSKGR